MRWQHGFVWAALLAAPAAAGSAEVSRGQGFGIELWTDRGNDAVYQPGQAIQVRARSSDDAFLLVYEIDAEGYVHSLFPERGSNGFVEGHRTVPIPPEGAEVELVVQGPVGEGYIVAIASREAFRELPWFLRPYDSQAEGIGYEGGPGEQEEGITAEGRVVGDPFVAMERIRRRVLASPEDPGSFASAYTAYYVHHEVRYPRYLCYDCHRPHQWAWWDGYDPYYATCSVFDFRVNWGWYWGPSYWFGSVPYYYYVYRYDCPPRYRVYNTGRTCYSSWDGWRRWRTLWGSRLTRYKSDPPSGYVPPSKFRNGGVWGDGKPAPPGFLVRGDGERVRRRLSAFVPIGRNDRGDPSWIVRPADRPQTRRGDAPWIVRPSDRPQTDRGDPPRIVRSGERPEPIGPDRPWLDRRGENPRRQGPARMVRGIEPGERRPPTHREWRETRPEAPPGDQVRRERDDSNAESRRHQEPRGEPSRGESRRQPSRGDDVGRGRGMRGSH
ncbi:MAG TPA: DUF4384 domain-containing protein [Candidatus Eisenbacteria bacterium]|jgi:hypothetical protein